MRCIHYLHLRKGCRIFVCNVMDCDSGFSDVMVMRAMSRQAYELKLKRFVCYKVSCLVIYGNRYIFFFYHIATAML